MNKIKIYLILCIIISFSISLLANFGNTIELKNGKVIKYSSFSKVGKAALRVVTEKGKSLTIPREQLSDAEIVRRFGSLVQKNYGKAYFIKSKLPKDYNPYEFRDSMKIQYPQMELLKWKSFWTEIKYHLYKPNKKNIKKGEKVPLVVFFHGATDQNQMHRHPQCLVFVQEEIQKKYPCYFIAPMLRNNHDSFWRGGDDRTKYDCTLEMECVFELIDDMVKRYPDLDGDRVYVTGLSSGGVACWEAITKYPERFAGAVPIAGASSSLYEEMINTKHKLRMGIWAFCHSGEKEYNKKYSIGLLNRYAKLGADARYSTFVVTNKYDKNYKHSRNRPRLSVKHAGQTWAYAEPDLIPWLFSHKRLPKGKVKRSKENR